MATVDPVEITPTLQNCSITAPAKSTDGKYYLDPSHMTVTLKADTGFIFKNDGKLTYQETEYASDDLVIKATNTDTASVTLPDGIDWNNQFSFPLTMSAVKDTPAPAPEPSKPNTPNTPAQPTKPVTPQLAMLKNSLRIPADINDDDALLQSYLDGAKEYLSSTLDEEKTGSRLDSPRAKVVINALAEIMYQSRGDNSTVQKDFPFTLRALINQLKY